MCVNVSALRVVSSYSWDSSAMVQLWLQSHMLQRFAVFIRFSRVIFYPCWEQCAISILKSYTFAIDFYIWFVFSYPDVFFPSLEFHSSYQCVCFSFIVICFYACAQVIMIEEPNGNNSVNIKLSASSVIPIASSTSNDDLSQSLSISEYTDADESMSAPTEYLAEVIFNNC